MQLSQKTRNQTISQTVKNNNKNCIALKSCVACKLMERVITKRIYVHLAENNLLSQAQRGFVSGHSTCTNLLECLNDWTLTVQNKKTVTVAYIDFSRAFDSVSHNKLLAKLHTYGIRGEVLLWLEHYFDKRTHQTRVGDCLSDEATLVSGVVQGSGIGPLSFLIFVDELAKLLERHGVVVKLFADDVKVYMEISNVDDAAKLQKALDLIAEWADDWQPGLSIGKCNTLSIGKHQDTTQYYIDGTELPCLPTAEIGSYYYLRSISLTSYSADYYQGPSTCQKHLAMFYVWKCYITCSCICGLCPTSIRI